MRPRARLSPCRRPRDTCLAHAEDTCILLAAKAGFALAAVAANLLALAAASLLAAAAAAPETCLTCHEGIEEMHPWARITCTGCHGGDATARTREEAHVAPRAPMPSDERVLPRNFDPDRLRFLNPCNLRVAGKTCGTCHERLVQDFAKSLHATTAGHLSDGLYENGVTDRPTDRYAIFPVRDRDGKRGPKGLSELKALPRPLAAVRGGDLAGHYLDLPRKACMRCHPWSRGRAVRGRLGMDGDYRSEGCAACHVTYADDGLSRSGDPTVPGFEPGHPVRHEMTADIPTQTCVHCHYGDASIGLSFRGLAQRPAGMAGGPNVPGTTGTLLNGVAYIRDDRVSPADIHFTRGLACIDCHTRRDVMGDGDLYGRMEDAVAIECTTCHGTRDRRSDLRAGRGRPHPRLRRDAGAVFLADRRSGREHDVLQARDLVDPDGPLHSPAAAAAMTPEHDRLECYACHAAWQPNFFGFHFDRNESFTQLDLLSGRRTPGRVTTQEKVFAMFRGIFLGWNSEGAIAPYMVGFSTMGTARNASGEPTMVQKMPVTRAGLSGLTLVAHQPHTTTARARGCAECHRDPAAVGLGSGQVELGRELAFFAKPDGLEVFAWNRKDLAESRALAFVRIRDAGPIALRSDPVRAHANLAFVVSRGRGIVAVDVRSPAFPEVAFTIETSDARDVLLAGDHLFLADGAAGVRIYHLEGGGSDGSPGRLEEVARIDAVEAQALALSGFDLFVADAQAGLAIHDVFDPAHPRPLATLPLPRSPGGSTPSRQGPSTPSPKGPGTPSRQGPAEDAGEGEGGILDVAVLFQPARPNGEGPRTRAIRLAAVAAGTEGLRLADVTDPRHPSWITGRGGIRLRRGLRERYVSSVALASVFELGSEGGELPWGERDYLFAGLEGVSGGRAEGYVVTVDVTSAQNPTLAQAKRLRGPPNAIGVVRLYRPPFLSTYLLAGQEAATRVYDVSGVETTQVAADLIDLQSVRGMAFERMTLDAMVDFEGRPTKDQSHAGARAFTREEMRRILRAPIPGS